MMASPPVGNKGDDMFFEGCSECGMHFFIADEKGTHEARCKAMKGRRATAKLSMKETWLN